jgi:hypothetical protein
MTKHENWIIRPAKGGFEIGSRLAPRVGWIKTDGARWHVEIVGCPNLSNSLPSMDQAIGYVRGLERMSKVQL